MKGLKLSPRIHYLQSNSKGSDFIVGDLHGMYDELLQILKFIGFDNSKDRLISVGDLIDRGPKSIELLREFRIRDNWHFVKGNHEDMMIQSLVYDNSNMHSIWLSNGGAWIYNENMDELQEAAIWLAENIPTVLVIGENDNRYNVCHAEITNINSLLLVENKDLDEWSFDEKSEDYLIWGRNIYMDYEDDHFINDVPFRYHSNDLSLTYVGHTPHFVDKDNFEFLKLEKHIYMDTGACFINHNRFKDQAVLSILNHHTNEYYYLDHNKKMFKGVLNNEKR